MDDKITLQQGLEQFYKKHGKYFSDRSYSEEGATFLRNHDIAHVVFGCDTSLYGEGIVKVWTSFGTTLSFWKVVNGYNEANAFELFREYSLGHMAKNIFSLLKAIPSTLFRVRKMNKPWPFTDYQGYLNVPVSKIRKEFNIDIIS